MKSTALYSDVMAVLDAALATGQRCTYVLPSAGAAKKWRTRAHMLRSILAHNDSLAKGGLVPPTTPYDSIVLRIDPSAQNVVIIDRREPGGVLMTESHDVVQPQARKQPKTVFFPEDPFGEIADELVKKYGGKDDQE